MRKYYAQRGARTHDPEIKSLPTELAGLLQPAGMLSVHGRATHETNGQPPANLLSASPHLCAVSVPQLVSAFGCKPKGWWFKPTQGRDPPFLREVFQPTTCFRMLSKCSSRSEEHTSELQSHLNL